MNEDQSSDAGLSDPRLDLIGFQLRRAAAAAALALTRKLEPVGLTQSEAGLLLLVAANEGTTLTRISRTTGAQAANLVPLIARLTQIGALSRKPGKGRTVVLSLTAEGFRLHAAVEAAFLAIEARIAQIVPADRKASIATILDALTSAVCLDES